MDELDTCDTSLAWKSMDARHNATTHDAIFPSPFFNFDPMQQVLILRIAQDRSIRDVTQSTRSFLASNTTRNTILANDMNKHCNNCE